jgi:hypothetical protein
MVAPAATAVSRSQPWAGPATLGEIINAVISAGLEPAESDRAFHFCTMTAWRRPTMLTP